jgi:hypothetical protein
MGAYLRVSMILLTGIKAAPLRTGYFSPTIQPDFPLKRCARRRGVYGPTEKVGADRVKFLYEFLLPKILVDFQARVKSINPETQLPISNK